MKDSYNKGVTDEFVIRRLHGQEWAGTHHDCDEDACICFNYRADRVARSRVLSPATALNGQKRQ